MCRHTDSAGNSASIVPADREVLPTNVKPLHYDVTMEPIFETFKFNGEETIEFQVNERTDFITLNTLEIEIHEAKIEDIEIKNITFDTDKQTVTFKFDDHLQAGKTARLYLKFTGELNDKMAGFTELLTKKMVKPNIWPPPRWNQLIVVELSHVMMNQLLKPNFPFP